MKQLPDETAKAFEAFRVYLSMGAKRSHQAVADKLRKSKTLISRWARTHSWKDRVLETDVDNLRDESEAKRVAEEQAQLERARAKVERTTQLEEEAWEVSRLFIQKARAMLNFPLSRQTTTSDGKTIIVNPGPWRLGDAARLADTADSLGRLALGMPGKVIEVGGKEGPLLPIAPPMVRVKKLTNAESDVIMRQMEAESVQRNE